MATAAETPKRTTAADTTPGKTVNSKTGATVPTTPSTNAKLADTDSVALAFDFSTVAAATTTLAEQHLKVLTDESSSYATVAKVCLQLTLAAGKDGASDTTTTSSSSLASGAVAVHDRTYASFMSTTWQSLFTCLQSHTDRRCRMIAARTLAITGRSAYARIRPSPLLYSQCDPTIHRLEDEVGSDIPVQLCTAALDDPDDGVAASAIASVGLLLLTGSTSTFGGLVEDELATHMRQMIAGISPYAPVLRSVTDEDPGIALQELSARIMDNVMSPRLLQLVDRIIHMQHGSDLIAVTLPCLTACLVHSVQVHPLALFQTDRTTFSKRWSELDVAGLIDTVVHSVLLPAMQHHVSGGFAQTAALSSLRLAHAQPYQHWVRTCCQWTVAVLQEEARTTATTGTTTTESRLNLLCAVVVAARALPMAERLPTLAWLASEILQLPRTVATPVACAGLRLEMAVVDGKGSPSPQQQFSTKSRSSGSYRRPARVALWTEIALSFFMDGPSDHKSRHQCLQTFLSSQLLARIIIHQSEDSADSVAVTSTTTEGGDAISTSDTGSSQQQRDELLLAFTSVAIGAGRRFRVTADGAFQVVDPSCEAVQEWLQLVWVVLASFMSCAFVPCPGNFLDENLSLLTAGLASYVQLLQEYMHFIGELRPSSSVALKLGSSACPPHILWDRMTESATFLSKCEIMVSDGVGNTAKLLDKLVSRELKQGIPSHQMRLFILALAADHWVQRRIACIRKHSESTVAVDISDLNVQVGREILLALAPKRLLAKILKAHVPPVDSEGKLKRDPIKKLVLESTKVSVACIENIALMACDWRRRYGSSQESKHIVSVAVGLLQGKVDETPVDELMKSVMIPTCEASVGRIQAYYEGARQGSSSDQSFPVSELVARPVKIKIKPLVSSSNVKPRHRDDVMREYLMQLCRQIVASRIQLAVQTSSPADSLFSAARPVNWLRLAAPPISESKDGRLYGCRGVAMAAWGHSVTDSSAASDAVQLLVAYTPRRYLRYDGEDDYRITVLMKAFNMTAIDIVEGLRLEFGITYNAAGDEDDDDPVIMEHVESLGCKLGDLVTDLPLSSSAVDYDLEVKSGEYITAEIALNDTMWSNSLSLVPSVVYRNVPVESEEAGVKWVGDKPSEGEGSTLGGESKSGEDDFQVTSSEGSAAFKGRNVGTENIRFIGEPLTLPPFIVFQPCPLVFLTDRCGDVDSFRFLWFRFLYHLAPLKIATEGDQPATIEPNPITRKIAMMSSLTWDGEAIPGGVATNMWAFMTLSGQRVCCVLTVSDSPGTESKHTLHFRGDDLSVLFSLIGSKNSRGSVVGSLLPGMSPIA